MRKAVANGLVGLLLAVLTLALTGPALAAMATLSGDVTYLEKIALPEGASLRVRLIDLSAPGTPTRVEAEAAIANPGQVPLTFTLDFDDRVIDTTHKHALVAEISAGLQLWFRNAPPYAVDPLAPAEPIMIVASFVGRLVQPEAPAKDDVADVPATPSILDMTWRLEAIPGGAVSPYVESTLSIASDMRAGGRGGCNSYFAQAAVTDESIRFSAIAATKMACASTEATVQEEAFFDRLGKVRFWRLDGETLSLLDGSGEETLRFARSAL
jgi:putative lipoprotein